jgi:hypothetical protein
MWDVTTWAAATWLKLTVLNALAVGVCWLLFGGTGGYVFVVIAAVLAEVYLTRQLVREWNFEAGLRWWWNR